MKDLKAMLLMLKFKKIVHSHPAKKLDKDEALKLFKEKFNKACKKGKRKGDKK